MAPSRPLFEPDSGDDTEVDTSDPTPVPRRSGLKKRLSEGHILNKSLNDTTQDDEGNPRRPVINDDAAEKRRRRKSTRIAVIEEPVAGPSNDGNQSIGDMSRSKQRKQIHSVQPITLPNIPEGARTAQFEELLKLTTDNKINQGNTWNLALIDYFHDMSLLRNGVDNSINFQRASLSLEGCVKIWTSRVDNVGSETAKLASNLASGSIEEEDGDGSDDDGTGAAPKKKRAHRPAATLVKDPDQLKHKKLELESNVDPLFKKTCADFDEGGAQGLLMNHLSLGVGGDGGLTVVFDASDSAVQPEDEEEVQEPQEDVDLSDLIATYLPDLGVLQGCTISESLDDFSFSNAPKATEDSSFFVDNTTVDDAFDDDDESGGGGNFDMDVDPVADGPAEDFFAGDEATGDGTPAADYYDQRSSSSVGPAGEEGGDGTGFGPFDPREIPDDRVLAVGEDSGEGAAVTDNFDKHFNQNWAGPQHWKLRRVWKGPETKAEGEKAKKPREKKEPFKIDFSTASDKTPEEIAAELFVKPKIASSINLAGTGPKSKKKSKDKRSDHRLPDDLHFSREQLVSLFLKPKFQLKMKGKRTQADPDADIDVHYWAKATADVAAGAANDEPIGVDDAPFMNTQFFNEDYDDIPAFDDAFTGTAAPDADDDDDQDLLAGTQEYAKRARPETVKYSKRAKRVDVRKLKQNIWKGLEIKEKSEEQMDVDEEEDTKDTREFGSVITNLQASYPPEKMEEISTSFCFICLLHLANEEGLKIRHGPDGDMDAENEEGTLAPPGNLWDLQVVRDPHATKGS